MLQKFEDWFNGLDKIIRIILIFIPFVGGIIEIILRVYALIKKTTVINLVGLIVFGFLSIGYLPAICDALSILLTDKQILLE